MSFYNLRAALVSHYLAGDFGLPTVYENKKAEFDRSRPWAAVTLVPNQPDPVTMGDHGSDEHTGFLQIDLYYPLDESDIPVVKKADEIRKHFNTGAICKYDNTAVRVTSCGRSVGKVEDTNYRLVLTIMWRAHTAR